MDDKQLDEISDQDLGVWEATCKRSDPHNLIANGNTVRRFVRTVRRLREENERLLGIAEEKDELEETLEQYAFAERARLRGEMS